MAIYYSPYPNVAQPITTAPYSTATSDIYVTNTSALKKLAKGVGTTWGSYTPSTADLGLTTPYIPGLVVTAAPVIPTISATAINPTISVTQNQSIGNTAVITAYGGSAVASSYVAATPAGSFVGYNVSIDKALPSGVSWTSTFATVKLVSSTDNKYYLYNGATITVSGTPTSPLATTNYTISFTDASGSTARASFSLAVTSNQTPLSVTSAVSGNKILTQGVSSGISGFATTNNPVGGSTPYKYAISPALPTGLSFNVNTGYITGTPTVSLSNTTFTVTVTDSGATPQTASSTFSMTVTANIPVATLAVPTTQLTQGISFTAFTPVTGTGGTAPLRYSISPDLPTGLTFSTSTGVVAGTPSVSSAAADYTVTVKDNLEQTASKTFNLTVKSIQVLTAIQTQPVYDLYKAVAVTAFTPITYNGGYGTVSYSLTPPTLPSGLTFSSGSISGTPTSTSSTATYVVNLSDQAGQTASGSFALSVTSIPIAVTQRTPSTLLTKNATFNSFAPVTAAGGYTPYTYVVSPSLPSGLSYASGTGIISGTATATSVATYYLVTVTDSAAQSGTSSFNLTVLQPDALVLTRVINTVTLVQGTAASPFTPISAVGGYVPSGSSLNYSISPALTAGLSINGNTGQITGTPSAYSVNTTTYSITVLDQAAQRSTATFDLNVLTPVFSVATAVPSTPGITGVAVTAFTPVTAVGGATPYQYELNTSLSAGLSFNTGTGRVSGTPTVANTSNYIVRITDAVGQTGTGSFNLSISNPVALVLTTVVTSTALVKSIDLANFTPVTAAGGQGSISLTVSPSLPAGLNFSNIGKITGTPTAESTQTAYLVKGTDSIGQTSSSTFYLAVNNSVLTSTVVVSISTLSQYVAITSFTPVTYVGGTPPVTYSVSPSLSSGISINPSTGAISGTPQTTLSTTSYAITVTDNVGGKTTGTIRLNVIAVPDLISTIAITTVTAYANQALTAITPVTVTGGYGSNSYSVSPSLPTGLLFSSVNGQITGTPSQLSSTATYSVTVSNQVNQTTSTNFDLTVKAQSLVATSSIPVSTLIVYQLSTPFIPVTGSGGFGSLSYQLTGANLSLPAGLSFNGSSGEVTGTPTALSETSTYVVLITDGISQTSTGSFTVSVAEVAPDPLNVTVSKSLVDITQNQSVNISPVQVLGGISPYAYTLTPALPTGLTFNSNGTITGTPSTVTSATTYNITVKDGQPQSITKTFSLSVSGGNVSGTGNVTQINNSANATSTTSGALIVAGGAGIAGNLYASAIYDNNNRVVTNVNPTGSTYIGIGSLVSTGTNVSFNITNLGVLTLTAGTDTAVSSNTGTITVWTTSTLQTVTNRGNTTTNAVNITNTTVSAGTMSGALTVAGGVGIGGKVVAGDDIVTTAKIGAGTLTPGAPLEVAFSNSNYSPTAYSSIKLNNGNSAGQSSIDSFINGSIKSRIRTDYSGNLNFSAYGGSINFYIGGDTDQGTNYMNVNTAGTLTVVNTIVGTITTANNIAGGALGSIPYQTTAGNTAFIGIGLEDSILYTDGTTATWKLLSSLAAATSNTSTYSGNVFVNPVTPAHQYYIGLTEYIDDFSPLDGDSQLIYDTTDRSLSSTKIIVTGTNASTSSVTSNALYVAGGVGISGGLYVLGPTTFENNVTFKGTSTYVLTTNTVYTDNILELHYPLTPGNTWAVNDLSDIGIRFHYYDTQDRNAFLGRDNATGYLEWIDSGVEDSTSTVAGTFGTFKTGSIILANTTATNSTLTGALVVAGGAGIGGALYVGGDITVLGKLNFTDASTPVSAGTATFSSVVITGTNATISTGSGALQVAGGVGIGGGLFVGGNTTITNTTAVLSTNSGALQVRGGVGIAGGLFVGGATTVTNFTNSTSTNTGALTVEGGVGVGGDAYIGGKLIINSTENATLYAGAGALQVAGGGYFAQDLTVGGSFKALGAFTVNGYSVSTATFNGGTVDNYTNFAPNTPTSSAVTGAVTIVGGLGIGGSVFVGGTVTATNFIGNVYATNTGSIQVGFANTASNLSRGGPGQIPYQSSTGTTSFISTGTTGQVLVSNGTGAPAFQNTLTLSSTAATSNTTTGALQVAGGVGIGGSLFVGGVVTATTFVGAFSGTSNFATTSSYANTATNIVISTATNNASYYITFVSTTSGSLGIVSDAGSNLTYNPGTNVLRIAGTATSTSTTTGALQVVGGVGVGGNIYAGNIYSNGQLVATGSAIFSGGNVSNIVYITTATGTTSTNTGALQVFGGVGIGGGLYVGGTVTATNFIGNVYATNTSTIIVGSATTATNIAGGTAGQIHYQSGPGITSFINTGAVGTILVSNGTAAPVFQNTLTLSSTVGTISTTTGALQVAGGVGIGSGLYVGGISTASVYVSNGAISGSSNQGAFTYGALTYSDPNNFAAFQTSVNAYAQVALQNSSAGTAASTDLIVSNDRGAAASYYGDFGMNSSGFTGVGSLNLPNAVYLASSQGDLVLGSFSNNSIRFVLNSGATDAITISTVTNNVIINTTATITSTVGVISTNTGALTVAGGVGIAGGLFVGGDLTATSLTLSGVFSPTSLTLSSTAGTVSTNTGALQVRGGAGIAGGLFVGGILTITNTATAISTATGAVRVVGGVGVGGDIWAANIYSNGALVATGVAAFNGGNVSNVVYINTTTASTSTTTGALVVQGGIGIGGNVIVGSTLTSTSTTTGALIVRGGVGIGGDIYLKGQLVDVTSGLAYGIQTTGTTSTFLITNITNSTSTTTGALVVTGGVGIGRDLNVGGTVTATNLTTIGGNGQITGVYQLNATNINVTNLTATNLSFAGGNVTSPLSITNTTSSTSTTTGALIVAGGVGVGGSVYASNLYTAGGSGIISGVYQLNSQNISATGTVALSGSVITVLTSTNTTTAVSTTTGALVIAGGVGVGGSVYAGSFVSQGGTGLISGVYQVSSQFFVSTATTTATSTTTGVLQIAGGAGIGGSVYVGGNLDIAGRLTFGNNSTATFGNLILTGTTPSVSSSTGALQVAGGAGVQGDVRVGGDLYVNNGTRVIPTNIQEFTASGSQTSFTVSGGYTAGTVQVFANGVNLGNGDFTASNGTTVVLNQARVAGDIIRIISGGVSSSINSIQSFSIAMSVAMAM